MIILRQSDGVQPCPHCGSTTIHIDRSLRSTIINPKSVKLGADGSLKTRYPALHVTCVCSQCYATSPRMRFLLPDGHKDRYIFTERLATSQELIDLLVEQWNHRYTRDGGYKLLTITLQPRVPESNG